MSQSKISSILIIIAFVLLFSCLGMTEDRQFTQDQKQDIKLQQHEKREKVNLTHINLQSLTFRSRQGQQTFILQTSQTEIVKGQIYVYWNSEDVYVTSDVKVGQEITLFIIENQRIIVDSYEFFTLTAFQFTAQKGKKYEIKIVSRIEGIPKLFTMSLSRTSPVLPNNQIKAIVKDQFGSQTEKILLDFRENMDALSSHYIMNYNLGLKLLALNDRYYYYQFFELMVVFMVTVMQILLIRKMLKKRSIV